LFGKRSASELPLPFETTACIAMLPAPKVSNHSPEGSTATKLWLRDCLVAETRASTGAYALSDKELILTTIANILSAPSWIFPKSIV